MNLFNPIKTPSFSPGVVVAHIGTQNKSGCRPVARWVVRCRSRSRTRKRSPRLKFRATVGLSICPGGSPPKKGINKEYNYFFLDFSLNNRVLKCRCLAFARCPGGFRELREAGRNHFHLAGYLLVPGITSYSQKLWGGIYFYRLR